MANFCSNCGRPLSEDGTCRYCAQQAQNSSASNTETNQAPTFRTEPAPQKPNVFVDNLKRLPKVVVDYIKDPVGTSVSEGNNRSMASGFIMLGFITIICFFATLLVVARFHYYAFSPSVAAWLIVGLFAPAIACALSFGTICLVLLIEKKKIDMPALISILGINLTLPAIAMILSLFLSLISLSVYYVFVNIQLIIWVVTFLVILYKVYDIKVNIINLLLVIACAVISYYIIVSLNSWLISSLYYFVW